MNKMRSKDNLYKFYFLFVITLFLIPIILENDYNRDLNINLKEKNKQLNDKLDFVFLLHANQANVPYADVANDICYHQVLETMLQYPDLHFPLHFSGSLLTELAWHNQSTLNLLRQGINSGQFEIIGSTYAQNVIYSHADDYDNVLQIDAHKKTIDNILNVEPNGFWNPERCWNQERYVSLITDGGYDYTFIEDAILADSAVINGYDEYLVKKTSYDGNELLIFNDDKSVINYVDNIAFTTEPSSDPAVITAVDDLINFLHDIYLNDTNDDYCVVYGQDMEVWGLWQIEGRPLDTLENVFSRLEYLYERLRAESSWLNVGTTQEFLETLDTEYQFFEIPTINDGSGNWMHTPSVDEGFDNWFDFSANDSRLNDFRDQFATTRERLKHIDQEINSKGGTQDVSSAENLLSYAKMVFVANQFEFGCIGCYFTWYYRTKSSLLTAEAALYSLNPSSETEILNQDLDKDGNNEFILRNDKVFAIITSYGARLINLYDIEKGEIILANDIPATYSTYNINGLDYPNGVTLSSYIETVSGSDLWSRTSNSYIIRPNTFTDGFTDYNDDFYDWQWKNGNRSTSINGNQNITFNHRVSDRIINKTFTLFDNEILIDYRFENTGNIAIQPEISLAFNPGNEEILYFGKEILNYEIKSENRVLNITNTQNKATLEIEGDENLISIEKTDIDPQFALGFSMDLTYIQPQSIQYYSFSLKINSEIDDTELTDTKSSDNDPNKTNSPFIFTMIPVLAFIVLIRRKK